MRGSRSCRIVGPGQPQYAHGMDEGHSGTMGGIANGWSDGLLVYDESGVHGSLRDRAGQRQSAAAGLTVTHCTERERTFVSFDF